MVDLNYNNNLFTFGDDGKLVYNDTVWDDLRVPLQSFKLGGSNDPNFVKFKDNGAGSQGVFAYQFDPGPRKS